MIMVGSRNSNLPIPTEMRLRNKSNKALAIRQSEALSGDYVAHLDINQVKRLADAALESRHGEGACPATYSASF